MTMPDILITEQIAGPAIDELSHRYNVRSDPDLWRDRSNLLEHAREYRAILVRNMTLLDRELLTAAARLEVIGRFGVGMDNIDLEAAAERGVTICYPPDENGIPVAEHVFALLLGLARHVVAGDRMVRDGGWDRQALIGFELFGKTMGVLGYGRIGMRVGTRARSFGMEVLAYDPYLSSHHPFVTETTAELRSLEDVLRGSDVVSCHLPLTEKTRGILNRETLAQMRPGALFINTSRGPVVDEDALFELLASGHLGGAGLDVRTVEPPVDARFNDLSNVLLAPHIAGWTKEAHLRVIGTVAADVDRVLQGRQPRYRWQGQSW